MRRMRAGPKLFEEFASTLGRQMGKSFVEVQQACSLQFLASQSSVNRDVPQNPVAVAEQGILSRRDIGERDVRLVTE